jgi:uncharacterized membrane protein YoaK (UPF0700 family)
MSVQRDTFLGICMGGLAGYVDTLGFVALYGLFTAHVTGNFVLIGSELSHPSHGVLLIKFLAFPAFILGVVVARLLTVAQEARGLRANWQVLGTQLLLLAGFMVAGLMAASGVTAIDPQGSWALAAGMLGAMGMGVQNAAAKLQFGQLAPTTVMTGNVTQLVIDLVDIARGKARCVKFFWPVVAFGVGASAGAFAYVNVGFWGLLAPLVVLVVMMSGESRKEALPAPAK